MRLPLVQTTMRPTMVAYSSYFFPNIDTLKPALRDHHFVSMQIFVKGVCLPKPGVKLLDSTEKLCGRAAYAIVQSGFLFKAKFSVI